MNFSYKGFDKSGGKVHDTIDAPDKAEAIESLRRRGIFVSEVAESKPGKRAASQSASGAPAPAHTAGHAPGGVAAMLGSFKRGQRLENVAAFPRQLSLLVSTGTPLVEAMMSLEHQTPEGPFKLVLSGMRSCVEEGAQLSDAMAQHPDYFDAVCRSLICAGEQGGKLEVMLQRLATLIRQQVKVRKTVKGAMVYPCLLIVVAIVVVCAMLGFVLPRFEGLFKSLDTPLPATTKILMSASAVLRAYWWAFVSGLAVTGVSAKLWLATSSGKQALDRFLTTAPLGVGKACRSFATARIARMLGTLLDGKVALLEALTLTRQSMSNVLYIGLLTRAEEAVTRGENVSAALSDPALINPSVCDALKSGERNGQMAPVLTSVATYLDEDNEVLVKTLTGLMEPIILIVLGLIVGVVAISMFLPLFDLTAAAGGPAGGGGGA
jgi:type II secretory pathway component PulF